jgi:hypothetical protein
MILERNCSEVKVLAQGGGRKQAIRDPIIPLVKGPTIEDGHQDHGQVIAASEYIVSPGCAALLDRKFANLLERLPFNELSPDYVDCLLRGETVPDTWTAG